ncbi:unnamed protein product [Diamesa tonsa]
MKIGSAVFYGVASFMITVVNKSVLTSNKFPSFLVLSLGQLIASIVVLFMGKKLRIVTIPSYSNDLVKKIFPLPLIYLGNMIFGLGGTKALSLPMFAALRRFSILMTMMLEFNQIKVSDFQKVLLSAGSSIAALLDPRRQDMIACLGETTGEKALEKILDQMKQTEEGRSILKEKPRINTKTVNLAELKQLPEDTFGYHYYKFLEDNQVTPDSRLEVRFMENPELGYVMTRYRETHDLVHTILGMPTNMLGEVAVKWVEAINTGLPMCYGGAVFGAVRLKTKQRQMYKKYYLPWAIKTGKELKPLLPVYWENRWSQNIDDLRKELNISKLELPVDI